MKIPDNRIQVTENRVGDSYSIIDIEYKSSPIFNQNNQYRNDKIVGLYFHANLYCESSLCYFSYFLKSVTNNIRQSQEL